MESLGLYISIPFCRSKCSYCNFASGVFPEARQGQYIERVVEDIGRVCDQAASLRAHVRSRVDSVYLGGGTPSILAPNLLRRLFSALRSEFEFTATPEITMECAPGQIDDGFLAAMVECGVNRVSFGVQSFIDREAAVTGRLHTRDIALCDIARVRSAGIRSINADLIAGLPHQTMDSWLKSLEVLIDSKVDHASVYMLEVDEDSRLGREVMEGGGRYHAESVPSDDLVADFYAKSIEILMANGLQQYEISNFSRPGRESIHNLKYWVRKPYLGFGLDAHSMLSVPDDAIVRFQTSDDLTKFLNGPNLTDVRYLSRQQQLEEAWFLGLRLNAGIDRTRLESEFGYSAAHSYDQLLDELTVEDLIDLKENSVSLTGRGRLLSNAVFARFLRDEVVPEPLLITIA
jgi:oxygen-independent coproporphyrinogen-3 oxidase